MTQFELLTRAFKILKTIDDDGQLIFYDNTNILQEISEALDIPSQIKCIYESSTFNVYLNDDDSYQIYLNTTGENWYINANRSGSWPEHYMDTQLEDEILLWLGMYEKMMMTKNDKATVIY